ncbi:Uncharacterized protein PECH_008535 [Penicillium ucsense]|uniref:Uncharacterized protein n=1 Tax=Penicillium ucsense TaxID=2839758 RepID=A0A8J8WI04_9EURO|nr:Uncharacterized protein PECM_006580 [Penicillium ucsense]KAF7734071.1 Uncharacterized protein PECH_008535 [Penicillium ucsense]
MATLTMTPPTRQPFASLDTPQMRSLMRSRLNRQTPQLGVFHSAKPLRSSIFIEDAENIAPSSHGSSGKRKRTLEDDDGTSVDSPKPMKSSRMALSVRDMSFSPRLCTPAKLSLSTPKSAPVLKPAGRSPPPKSSLSARRSTIAKARPEPSRRAGVTRPFSLAKALSHGKIKAPAPPQPKGPDSWFFDIHVDSEQEEMTNLMQHSTGVLDISDDESKASPGDDRGKENVPPTESGLELAALPAAMSSATVVRNLAKIDEDRAPLGELNAADYYPDGCNAFSVEVVHDDEASETAVPIKTSPLSQSPLASSVVTEAITSAVEDGTPNEGHDIGDAIHKVQEHSPVGADAAEQ